jgi:hypothetical protein
MDDAIEFFHELIRRKFEAEWAVAGDTDAAVEKKVSALQQLYKGYRSGIGRVAGQSKKMLQELKGNRESLRPRGLMAITKLKHPKLGVLYCGYLGLVGGPYSLFDTRELAQKTRRGFKLISSYHACSECDGTGKIGASKCRDCRGAGWTHRDGVELGSFPEPIETKKLLAPTYPASVIVYDAL